MKKREKRRKRDTELRVEEENQTRSWARPDWDKEGLKAH